MRPQRDRGYFNRRNHRGGWRLFRHRRNINYPKHNTKNTNPFVYIMAKLGIYKALARMRSRKHPHTTTRHRNHWRGRF
ncbi:uncharacterized protein VTP21DRAFT_9230 [Calcarisporiella thermophila]|uniref:uncharacterized protein n=1 Tax=Calcarisporiella thermophila TaxID=911321 RepID=UPI00374293C1